MVQSAFKPAEERRAEVNPLAFAPTHALTPAEKAAFGFNYTTMQALNGVFNIDQPREKR